MKLHALGRMHRESNYGEKLSSRIPYIPNYHFGFVSDDFEYVTIM